MVEDPWRLLLDHGWEDLFVDVPRGEVCSQPVLPVLILVVVGQPGRLPDLVVFVVPHVEDDGWVVTQSAHVSDGLLADGLEEGRERRVVAAGKHEVLPDHDPELVARVVEGVILVDASAPDSVVSVSVRLWVKKQRGKGPT